MIYFVLDAHESALRSIRRVVTETAPPTPTPVAAAAVVKQLQARNVLVVTGAGCPPTPAFLTIGARAVRSVTTAP